MEKLYLIIPIQVLKVAEGCKQAFEEGQRMAGIYALHRRKEDAGAEVAPWSREGDPVQIWAYEDFISSEYEIPELALDQAKCELFDSIDFDKWPTEFPYSLSSPKLRAWMEQTGWRAGWHHCLEGKVAWETFREFCDEWTDKMVWGLW